MLAVKLEIIKTKRALELKCSDIKHEVLKERMKL
jgi:hypothetical protein